MRGPASRRGRASRSPPGRRGRFFAGRRTRPRAVPFFQPKLTIGAPGDRFEQQADRVADRVVAGETAPEVQRMCAGCAAEGDEVRRQPMEEEEEMLQARPDSELRRQPAEEEEEMVQASRRETLRRQPAGAGEREEEQVVQTSRDGELRRQPMEEEEEMIQPEARGGAPATASPTAATPSLARGIDGLRGGGRPLGRGERAFFEPRLGRDLSSVRLHTGGRAAELASSINARAFTVGSDVFFGAAQYAPAAREGRHLLAHELTHVLQQEGAPRPVQRKISFDPPTYTRRDPAARTMKEQPTGLTTPTIGGQQLPDNYEEAGQLIVDALAPRTYSSVPGTGECRYDDFDVSLSANVIVPSRPGRRGWEASVPGGEIKGSPEAEAACGSKGPVRVRMIGKPDHQAIFEWIEANEQEHVEDLEKVKKDHLDSYFDEMLALRASNPAPAPDAEGTGWLEGLGVAHLVRSFQEMLAPRSSEPDHAKCAGKLDVALGNKAPLAARDFLDAWLASLTMRDTGGGHELKNQINIRPFCNSIKIKSRTR